ncbi:MAG: sensor histidine kinase [Akkermansiaceae bacterium]
MHNDDRNLCWGPAVPAAAASMIRIRHLLVPLTFLSSIAGHAENSMAARFSSEWKALSEKTKNIETTLTTIAAIPAEDFGDKRPFLRVFNPEQTDKERQIELVIRLRWPEKALVDLIALVPARKFDSLGLDSNYGFPEDFDVSLILPNSETIQIAEYREMSQKPAFHGHPILARPTNPVEATGVEVNVTRARPSRKGEAELVIVALSEIFCFSGLRNLAQDSTVEIIGPDSDPTPPFWNQSLLNDGKTPLGLPERPLASGDPEFIGWISNAHRKTDIPLTISLDLGGIQPVNGLRLFPALRPSIADFPGFGIPENFRLTASTEADTTRTILIDQTTSPTPEVGHNALDMRFPEIRARHLHLEATQLWKPHAHYPAFLAFSEIQILHKNEVVSQNSKITVPEAKSSIPAHAKQFWAPSSLVDGNGPDGELLSSRAWIEELGLRLNLESQLYEARSRMTQLENSWRRNTLLTAGGLGLSALALVAILPFRYRTRERKRIREIRERIAGDLHDDVGSNLGSIQMLSTMACQNKDNQEELDTIHRVAAETVSSVRDIVWLLHPRKEYRIATIDHLRETAAILLDPINNLQWSLSSDFPDWTLGDEDGRNLVLFFREVLHNIRRHSQATQVIIRLAQDKADLVVTISDNGRGIPAELLSLPSSLRALRQRASRLGGVTEIQSTSSSGTTVLLRFKPRSPGSAPAPSQNHR